MKISEKIRLGKYLRGALVLGDFAILNLAYAFTIMISTPDAVFDSKLVWLIANLSLLPSVYFFSDIHRMRIVYADRVMLSVVKSVVVEACAFTALLYIFDFHFVALTEGLERGLIFVVSFFVMLSLWWLISRRLLKKVRRMGLNFKRVIIIGAGKTAHLLFNELQSDAGYGYRTMGFFDDNPKNRAECKGSYVDTIDHVADFVVNNKIDIIYYTLDAEDNKLISQIMQIAEESSTSFVYVPKFNRILNGQFQLSAIGNIPIMKHSDSPLYSWGNRLMKRALDLMISIPFLVISPIIFIPIAVAIKLTSPGPVFFRQKRTGIHGSEFVCYKFRTMKVNCEADKLQATEDDPRKTRLGDFLRRSSLDELPQFFNVFLGNMSVVGPRPHMISHTEEYSALIDKYMIRHAVKPGITGWAQVNGYRGATKYLWQMEKRVEFDVWYVRNWNIFLDIKIIVLTIFNAFRGEENAY